MKVKFKRRVYRNWRQLWQDLKWTITNRRQIDSGLVSPAFRERLMLTVTEVNGCRYCSYFHAKLALEIGLSEEETREFLQGNIKNAPAEELPALLYAQHWSNNDARPEQNLREDLLRTYGSERANAIESVLYMIRLGNLLGNLGDYLLYKLSFGHLGLLEEEKSSRSTSI